MIIGCIISLLSCLSAAFGSHKCNCKPDARYRTFDGSCNNLQHPTWGMSGTLQTRFKDVKGNPLVDFSDGVNLPRGFPNKLPEPRLVSNVMGKTIGGDKQDVRSAEHMAFGQLIAHDFIETELHKANCCNMSDPNFHNPDICFPFHTPPYDEVFHAGCKNFARAVRGNRGGYQQAVRENRNFLSSVIDATFLYGNDTATADKLRVPNSFLMKTDQFNLLPTTDGGSCFKIEPSDRCPYAGDHRLAESPNLGLNHLLFVREHNRLSTLLHNLNPHWDNERVYQETRRIIIAQVQHIVYNHFLPSFLKSDTMWKYNLYSESTGYVDNYDPNVDMSIRNGFGTAPYRFGHSQVMATIEQINSHFMTEQEFKMEDHLMSPHIYEKNYGRDVENLARWLVAKPSLKIDNEMVDSVRNKLFYKSKPPGTDLMSLNIQRGRDQGTPGYNKWREFCGLPPFTKFSDFGYFGYKLSRVYSHVDDVDFFVGGLLEEGEKGSVGPTFSCVIGLQFYLLKIGDRFWYESGDKTFAFSVEQLNSIKGYTTLSKLWCMNFGLDRIQRDIFTVPSKTNPLVHCDDIPDIDLNLWKEHYYG